MTPKELIRSLRACAGFQSSCRECIKKSAFGCARDLKLEAAALIEKWNEEREKKRERPGID